MRDPSSGDKIDGIRIKPRIPAAAKTGPIICEDCKKPIQGVGNYSAEDVARINQSRYHKTLCAECSKKLTDAKDNQEPEKAEQDATPNATEEKEET